MGYIYIIRNKINKKVYIGQTVQTISNRFKKHLSDSKLLDKNTFEYLYKNKLYNAFRKYGFENFYIELLEECSNDKLNDKEIYYIEKYNSYNDGYNTTIGGEGRRLYNFTKKEETDIVNKYKGGYSIRRIADKYNCSIRPIENVLHSNKIDIHNNSLQILMYNKQFEPIRLFNSIEESREYIINNTDYISTDVRNYYRLLHKSFDCGCVAYGFRWQLTSDLVYSEKIFKTKFDKEAYINGEFAYQPDGKKYWVANNTVSTPKKHSKYNKNINTSSLKCKVCNKTITCYSKTGMCNKCANKPLNKPDKPSKEKLKKLLEARLQKKQIADIYGRTASTVHYWINKYDL